MNRGGEQTSARSRDQPGRTPPKNEARRRAEGAVMVMPPSKTERARWRSRRDRLRRARSGRRAAAASRRPRTARPGVRSAPRCRSVRCGRRSRHSPSAPSRPPASAAAHRRNRVLPQVRPASGTQRAGCSISRRSPKGMSASGWRRRRRSSWRGLGRRGQAEPRRRRGRCRGGGISHPRGAAGTRRREWRARAVTMAALSEPGASASVTAPRSMAIPAERVIWIGPWMWKAPGSSAPPFRSAAAAVRPARTGSPPPPAERGSGPRYPGVSEGARQPSICGDRARLTVRERFVMLIKICVGSMR